MPLFFPPPPFFGDAAELGVPGSAVGDPSSAFSASLAFPAASSMIDSISPATAAACSITSPSSASSFSASEGTSSSFTAIGAGAADADDAFAAGVGGVSAAGSSAAGSSAAGSSAAGFSETVAGDSLPFAAAASDSAGVATSDSAGVGFVGVVRVGVEAYLAMGSADDLPSETSRCASIAATICVVIPTLHSFFGTSRRQKSFPSAATNVERLSFTPHVAHLKHPAWYFSPFTSVDSIWYAVLAQTGHLDAAVPPTRPGP